MKLAVRSAYLPGHGSTSVPFTVAVPRRARPGDHFVGITAVDQRVLSRPGVQHGPIRLRLIPRLAMTVRLRLPGPSTKELALGPIKIAVAPSGASLTLGISNPGNRLIGVTTGGLTVSQGATRLFSKGIELAAFVPQTAITYHVPWILMTATEPLVPPRVGVRATDKRLSPREREILARIALGASGQQIATELFISPETVRTHLRNILVKLGAQTRPHAVALALQRGEIMPEQAGAPPRSR